ncbi:MAG TPA: hypothetical protein VKB19_11090 [Pedobacter sp.]|nr:hypothetical protein [Pedobacter sp.]
MKQPDEVFQVTVQINQGLEPMTLTIVVEKGTSGSSMDLTTFKVTRDKDSETLAVLSPGADHSWRILKGKMDSNAVDLIGAAIDAHYA